MTKLLRYYGKDFSASYSRVRDSVEAGSRLFAGEAAGKQPLPPHRARLEPAELPGGTSGPSRGETQQQVPATSRDTFEATASPPAVLAAPCPPPCLAHGHCPLLLCACQRWGHRAPILPTTTRTPGRSPCSLSEASRASRRLPPPPCALLNPSDHQRGHGKAPTPFAMLSFGLFQPTGALLSACPRFLQGHPALQAVVPRERSVLGRGCQQPPGTAPLWPPALPGEKPSRHVWCLLATSNSCSWSSQSSFRTLLPIQGHLWIYLPASASRQCDHAPPWVTMTRI